MAKYALIADLGPSVVRLLPVLCYQQPATVITLQHSVTVAVEFYLYPTVSTALVHSVKPKLTE